MCCCFCVAVLILMMLYCCVAAVLLLLFRWCVAAVVWQSKCISDHRLKRTQRVLINASICRRNFYTTFCLPTSERTLKMYNPGLFLNYLNPVSINDRYTNGKANKFEKLSKRTHYWSLYRVQFPVTRDGLKRAQDLSSVTRS